MRREDFTRHLVECFHTKSSGRTVISSWEPDAIAAPERHVQCGLHVGLLYDKLHELLMKSNRAFDTIESMLNISFTKAHIKSLHGCELIDEKEHVWLFAYKWLTKYYDFLMEPDVLHSPFYRQDHTRFIELLTKMCAVLPEKRLSFLDAMRLWCPGHAASESSEDSNDDASDDASQNDVKPVAESPWTDGLSKNLLPSSSDAVRRRLVLKGFRGPQGRNKTRKSSRS